MKSISNNYSPTPILISPQETNGAEINAKIKNLIKQLLECPKAKCLAQTAYDEGDSLKGKKGTITVKFDPMSCLYLAGKTEHGFCDHTHRVIALGSLDPFLSLSILIFEIANLSQTKTYRKIQAQINSLTRDEYSKQIEYIEHLSGEAHNEILQYGVASLRWDPKYALFATQKDFKERWKKVEKSEHAEILREQFDLLKLNDKKQTKKAHSPSFETHLSSSSTSSSSTKSVSKVSSSSEPKSSQICLTKEKTSLKSTEEYSSSVWSNIFSFIDQLTLRGFPATSKVINLIVKANSQS